MASAAGERLSRSLVTPEGVDLGVTLADAGARAAAFLIDAIIMVVTLVVATLAGIYLFIRLGETIAQPLIIAWLLGFFLLRNGYFVLFEAGRRAASPGKRLLGLRVVARDGAALTVDRVVARNLMREIEVFLPLTILAMRQGQGLADTATTLFGLAWVLLFTLFPLFNRDRLRVGDLLAGTWVIELRTRRLAADLAAVPAGGGEPAGQAQPGEAYVFTQAQLEAYGIRELQKLEEVLRVNDAAALATVAQSIATRIAWTGPVPEPRPFLVAYYAALRAHLEKGVLLGRRRADKHDS